MKKSIVYVSILVLVLSLFACSFCACGGEGNSPAKETGEVKDTAKQTEADTTPDTTPDTVPDTTPDTAPDTTPDTETPPNDDPLQGEELRIISYNVLCELWNDRLPIPGRDTVTAELITTNQPDVIALQEMSTAWYDALGRLIGDEYEFVNKLDRLGQTNFTGLAYNKRKVELIQEGCEQYSVGDTGIRLMNWGYFELKESGARFIVMNTHWNTSLSTEPENEYRLVHAREMGERVALLAYDFECPVIAAGDFNALRASEEYKLYEGLARIKNAQVHADERINDEYVSLHLVGQIPLKIGDAIDQITYTEGAHALRFEMFVDQSYLNVSDHTPIMCDFLIRKK